MRELKQSIKVNDSNKANKKWQSSPAGISLTENEQIVLRILVLTTNNAV